MGGSLAGFPISGAVQFFCCRATVTGFPTSGAVSPCRTCPPVTGFPTLGAVVVCPSLHKAAGFPTFGAARTCFGFHIPDDRLVQISPPQARPSVVSLQGSHTNVVTVWWTRHCVLLLWWWCVFPCQILLPYFVPWPAASHAWGRWTLPLALNRRAVPNIVWPARAPTLDVAVAYTRL